MTWTNLYTKKQIQRLFFLWKVEENIPTKGKKVVINFPNDPIEYCFGKAEIEWAESPKSVYGERLYWLTFYHPR